MTQEPKIVVRLSLKAIERIKELIEALEASDDPIDTQLGSDLRILFDNYATNPAYLIKHGIVK